MVQLCGALQLENNDEYYFACGISKMFGKKAKKAVPDFQKAWDMNNQCPKYGNALVVALYKAKKIDEAVKKGEEIIKTPHGKEYVTLFYNLAYIYTEKKKDAKKGEEYYQQYLQLAGVPDEKLESKIKQTQKKR